MGGGDGADNRESEPVPVANRDALLAASVKRLEEAIQGCREALRLRPGEPKFLRLLGTALRDLGELDEAEAAIDAALSAAPDFAEHTDVILSELGCDAAEIGRYRDAGVVV